VVIANRPVTCDEVRKRFPNFFVDSTGDLNRSFNAVSSPETAPSSAAVFISNPKHMQTGLASEAKVIVVHHKALAGIPASETRTILAATNVELAMASVINEFFLKTPYTNASIKATHPSATIEADAEIPSSARIGPNAFIGARVKLGENVYIGAGAVIEDQAEIGTGSVIHPQVFIGHSTLIGARCEIHPSSVIGKEGYGYAHDEKGNHYRIPHQGRVVIEDDVHIGACCTVDRATFGETRIEAGTKMDNQVHIAHNCRVGRNSLLTAGFMVAGSSRLGANFVAGGRSVVTGHIEICDNVQISGLSGVNKSISEPGAYGGFPLLPLQQSIKVRAAVAQLPEMRKQLARIVKQIEPDQDPNAATPEG
jgi:UDP-3-O-[3-hydroxymyristoyl] glucosamine N-acyltransferase